MGKKNGNAVKKPADKPRRNRGAHIPLAAIRRYAKQVADRFQPNKIILFGSYAYGTPHDDSDVDLLVIMPARDELDQAFRIRVALPAPFPMDLLVRTPKQLQWRLAERESFSTEVMIKGRVLYEQDDAEVGAKGTRRPPRGRTHGGRTPIVS